MKKITLIISLLGVFIMANAQVDNYNPYQHLREEQIKSIQESKEERKNFDCESVKESIEKAISEYLESKQGLILDFLGSFYCPEVNSLMKIFLNSEEDAAIRRDMIHFLGRMPDETNASFLFEFSKNPKITDKEKISIAESLCGFEKYDLAIELLNSFCLDENGISDWECITAYELSGERNIALKFYNDLFDRMKIENNRARLFGAAFGLASLGEYEKAYPVILESLESSTSQHGVRSALFALAIIGDEKAFEIIKEYAQHENTFIASYANFILDYIERERRTRCEE